MKKKKVIISIISLMCIFLAYQYIINTYFKEIIALKTWTKNIQLDVTKYNPVISHFEEEWCPNGDGYVRIEFILSNENTIKMLNEHRDVFNPLPIDVTVLDIEQQLPVIQNGYYIYKKLIKSDPRNYLFFSVNDHSGKCFLEVNIM